ncbi:MAG TPA: DinB family protein [Flavobacteriales bacterium]|nr:DinB family protein [Flavobacteriales bacterium]
MIITQPVPGEYPAYYENYFPLLDKNKPVLEQMHEDGEKCAKIIAALPQQKWHYAYAEGKWTCLQVLQHIIDTERIFTYRALCIARGEKQSLPGFNENTYAATVEMKHKTAGLVSLEWTSVRQASLAFYMGLTDAEAKRVGHANNSSMSVNAIAYITVGHARHHFNVLAQRYFT